MTMNIEQQVTNVKLSKKLKALGIKQESVWCWCEIKTDPPVYSLDQLEDGIPLAPHDHFYSAFTCKAAIPL